MIFKILLALLLFSLSFSQTIKVEVKEFLDFSITFQNCSTFKNVLNCKITVYNKGSLDFDARLILETEDFKVYSDKLVVKPGQEVNLNISSLFFRTGEALLKILVANKSIEQKLYLFFNESINKTESKVDYIYENGKLELIGNLKNKKFIVLSKNATYIQKTLKNVDEIKIFTEESEVKILFFDEKEYFEEVFVLKKPSILKKATFKIKKIITLIFSA